MTRRRGDNLRSAWRLGRRHDGPRRRRGHDVDRRRRSGGRRCRASTTTQRRAGRSTSALFPNLLLSLHPDYVMTHRIEPLEPGARGRVPVAVRARGGRAARTSTRRTRSTSGTSPTARTGPRSRACSGGCHIPGVRAGCARRAGARRLPLRHHGRPRLPRRGDQGRGCAALTPSSASATCRAWSSETSAATRAQRHLHAEPVDHCREHRCHLCRIVGDEHAGFHPLIDDFLEHRAPTVVELPPGLAQDR